MFQPLRADDLPEPVLVAAIAIQVEEALVASSPQLAQGPNRHVEPFMLLQSGKADETRSACSKRRIAATVGHRGGDVRPIQDRGHALGGRPVAEMPRGPFRAGDHVGGPPQGQVLAAAPSGDARRSRPASPMPWTHDT